VVRGVRKEQLKTCIEGKIWVKSSPSWNRTRKSALLAQSCLAGVWSYNREISEVAAIYDNFLMDSLTPNCGGNTCLGGLLSLYLQDKRSVFLVTRGFI
jgi:hypothetical protein